MKTFDQLYATTQSRSLLDQVRMQSVYDHLKSVDHIQGHIAELGVYKGGLSFMMSHTRPLTTLHLYDTFEGMPDRGQQEDEHKSGDFGDVSFLGVMDFLNKSADIQTTLCPHKGVFPATTAGYEHIRYAFVHLDADLQRSTMDGLLFFWPRMNPGGLIMLDDLDLPSCPGVRKAVECFPPLLEILEKPVPYQGLLRKPL